MEYRRGDVFEVNFPVPKGIVKSGKYPAVIYYNKVLRQDERCLDVIPLIPTDGVDLQDTHVIIDKAEWLPEISVAVCESPITVSKSQLGQYLSSLSSKYIKRIEAAFFLAGRKKDDVRTNENLGLSSNVLGERKQRFIDEMPLSIPRTRPKRLMRRLEQLEKQLELDFCQITQKWVIDFVLTDIIASKRLFYINIAIELLQRYCQWCIDNGYTDHNAMDGIKGEDIDLTRIIMRDMFSIPKSLEAFLSTNRPPIEPDNIATMYHSYYWTLYMGLTPEQACKLKKSDIRNNGRQIQCDNEVIDIIPNARMALLTAAKMEEVVYGRRQSILPLYKSDKLFVNTTKEMTPRDFWYLDRRYKDRLYTRGLDWEDVYLSGLFHRTLQQEYAGKPVDFGYLYEDDLKKERLYQSQIRYIYENKVKDIENMYFWWKKAFVI